MCSLELIFLPRLFVGAATSIPSDVPGRRAALVQLVRWASILPVVAAVSGGLWLAVFGVPRSGVAILAEVLLFEFPAIALAFGALWALFRWLLRDSRYSRSDNWLVTGGLCLAVGVAASIAWSRSNPPITEADLNPTCFEAGSYTIYPDRLMFQSGERRFSTYKTPWRPELSDQDLGRALGSGTMVTLWLYRGKTEIFGLEAGGVAISKSRCVEDYMEERRVTFWVLDALLSFGAGAVAGGIWLRRGEPDPEEEDLLDDESDESERAAAPTP
jgi:hypothetical protein